MRLLECLETLETSSGAVGKDSGRAQAPPIAQPASVLRRLPRETPVPQVAAPVRWVFDSFELQESLYKSCKNLVEEEMRRAKRQFLASYRGGSAIKVDACKCLICGRSLNEKPPEFGADVSGDEAACQADPVNNLLPSTSLQLPTSAIRSAALGK